MLVEALKGNHTESNTKHTGTKFLRGEGDDKYLVKVRNSLSTQSHKKVTNKSTAEHG